MIQQIMLLNAFFGVVNNFLGPWDETIMTSGQF
jgi:hypothetical protein